MVHTPSVSVLAVRHVPRISLQKTDRLIDVQRLSIQLDS